MRDIKFRVWCEFEINGIKHCDMAGPENWFLLTQNGKLLMHGPVKPLEDPVPLHTKLEVMQFTGIKDKNGVEIYEGDIIKRGKYSRVCEWEGIGFDPFVADGEHRGDGWHWEVIGNIHQNPELLEAK